MDINIWVCDTCGNADVECKVSTWIPVLTWQESDLATIFADGFFDSLEQEDDTGYWCSECNKHVGVSEQAINQKKEA